MNSTRELLFSSEDASLELAFTTEGGAPFSLAVAVQFGAIN